MSKNRLHCILCRRPDVSFEEQAEKACAGGAEVVRFDPSVLPAREAVMVAQKLREICRRHKALLIVAARPDIALAADADGVHLGQDDIPLEWARQILGPRRLIGCAASTLGQAMTAAEQGAQYIAVGPLFSETAGAPSVDLIRLIKKRVKTPVIAEGGVTAENVAETVASGADGAAVAEGLCVARDIAETAQRILGKIEQAAGQAKQIHEDTH